MLLVEMKKDNVEGSVKYLRNKIFLWELQIQFWRSSYRIYGKSINETKMKNSKIEEEKKILEPTKPPLELGEIRKVLLINIVLCKLKIIFTLFQSTSLINCNKQNILQQNINIF